jgi:uncharacterized BrkB/YihY/UPF0761 family membrane protein
MTNNDQIIRQKIARYRAMRFLSLIQALGLALVGIIGLGLAASGRIFATADGQPKGWLYENLGKDNATIAAGGLMLLVTVIGVIWSYRVFCDMTGGYKRYEEELRKNVTGGVESANHRQTEI